MHKRNVASSSISILGFALCLLLPSTYAIQKHGGSKSVLVYLGAGIIALIIILRLLLPRFLAAVSEKQALLLFLLTFFGLILVVAILYPIANSGIMGTGSDAEDALNIAATELLHGRYPYYARTYLGNPIAPFPGAVLLAVPFVLLGNSAFQNLFWLAAFFFAVRGYLKNGVSALALFWLIIVFSPSVLQNLVTGTDRPANAIYVLLFMWLMVVFISKRTASAWKKIIPSVFLGIGLSSRSNFLLLVPLLFSTLVQNAGWKQAIKYIAITGLTFAAVTLPFMLYDPQGFAPLLEQSNKVARYQSILPLAGIIIPLVGGLIALALSLQRMDSNCLVLFRNCAIVQAFPVLCVVILSSMRAKSLTLIFAGYGLFSLFFGVVALWPRVVEASSLVGRRDVVIRTAS